MKKILMLVLVFPVLLFSQNKNNLGKYYSEKEEKEILKVVDNQVKAWNDGNVEGYMEGFWHSDSLRMVTRAGIQYGWDLTLKMYKDSFKGKEAMGTLRLRVVKLDFLNKDAVFVISKWEVDQKEKMGGHLVQLWKKIKGKWVITTDYTT